MLECCTCHTESDIPPVYTTQTVSGRTVSPWAFQAEGGGQVQIERSFQFRKTSLMLSSARAGSAVCAWL